MACRKFTNARERAGLRSTALRKGRLAQPDGGKSAGLSHTPRSCPTRHKSGPGGFPGGNPGAAPDDTRRCVCRDKQPSLPLLFSAYSFKVISTTVSLGSGRG